MKILLLLQSGNSFHYSSFHISLNRQLEAVLSGYAFLKKQAYIFV